VKLLRDHLHSKGRQLWIWGDRLLDGKTTGMGEWEASMNDTYRAIDLVPKDVTICDWHYERAEPAAAYFAMKGFNVVTCPWNNAEPAVRQLQDMVKFRQQSSRATGNRFQGMVQTVWSGPDSFLREYYAQKQNSESRLGGKSAARCFIRLFDEMSAQSN